MPNTSRNEEEEFKMLICCSDGVSIDAKPFYKESDVVRGGYKYKHFDEVTLEYNSDIIYKVRDFCEERAKIQNDPSANDEILVQQKLNAFNSEFRRQYRTHAIDLMIVAFRLEMKSLSDLLMEDVVDILTSMTSKEIYKIFFVNLKDYDHTKFEVMIDVLHECDGDFNQIR